MHLKLEVRKEEIKSNIRYVKEGMKLPDQLINVLRTDLEIDKLHAFGFYMCVIFALRLLKNRKNHVHPWANQNIKRNCQNQIIITCYYKCIDVIVRPWLSDEQ